MKVTSEPPVFLQHSLTRLTLCSTDKFVTPVRTSPATTLGTTDTDAALPSLRKTTA